VVSGVVGFYAIETAEADALQTVQGHQGVEVEMEAEATTFVGLLVSGLGECDA
jgi:hypothetical protein